MAIVQPKSVKYRVWATHLVMWGFLALIIFPVIMVIAISFRNGNFSVGEIIPSNPTLDHWKLALGMSITNADGSITPPPLNPSTLSQPRKAKFTSPVETSQKRIMEGRCWV